MPTARAIARLDQLIWALIYGGLFALVLGIASAGVSPAVGWSLGALGCVAVVAGAVLIWVRSRLKETPAPEDEGTR